jgi:hypothetical protein
MCHYLDYTEKYDQCTADPTHVVSQRRYDKCQIAIDTGNTCTDATPAKGKNGELIQLGTSRRNGTCPKCLS